jgi:quercetin dioxygenase-like cupin family protein
VPGLSGDGAKVECLPGRFSRCPGGETQVHQHDGVEFLYILKGSLTIKIAAQEFLLESEDAIYFDLGRSS